MSTRKRLTTELRSIDITDDGSRAAPRERSHCGSCTAQLRLKQSLADVVDQYESVCRTAYLCRHAVPQRRRPHIFKIPCPRCICPRIRRVDVVTSRSGARRGSISRAQWYSVAYSRAACTPASFPHPRPCRPRAPAASVTADGTRARPADEMLSVATSQQTAPPMTSVASSFNSVSATATLTSSIDAALGGLSCAWTQNGSDSDALLPRRAWSWEQFTARTEMRQLQTTVDGLTAAVRGWLVGQRHGAAGPARPEALAVLALSLHASQLV